MQISCQTRGLGNHMQRPAYLTEYLFDWELFDVILSGKSALDANSFLGDFQSMEKVLAYLTSYGLNPEDPVVKAELFGNFQEAISFIRRYFLKENNSLGLPLQLPALFYQITDVAELFLVAANKHSVNKNHRERVEESMWAGAILKVMHTIIHMDKDLRQRYFPIIQQQIFDKFYKHLKRDADNKLTLSAVNGMQIPLYDFVTKSKKTRDSIIIKLLHKAENVAEELFDRVGVRFITHDVLDTLRVVKFLQQYNVIIPHNIKPSRSINGLFDFDLFRPKWRSMIRMSLRNNLTQARFHSALNRDAMTCRPENNHNGDVKNKQNVHSSKSYRAIQFTCRQLISYKDPFFNEITHLKNLTKEIDARNAAPEICKVLDRIQHLDVSHWSQEVKFFYPFEIQIVDYENNLIQTQGEASHEEYKNSQLLTAMKRVFGPLIKFKNINL